MDHKIDALLNSPLLTQIEDEVSTLTNFEIDADGYDWIKGIVKEEIQDSQLFIDEIESYLVNNGNKIINFTCNFLKHTEEGKLCKGFSIGYSIYLIYLETYNTKSIIDYLKRRRIPNSKKVYHKLKKAYSEIHSEL